MSFRTMTGMFAIIFGVVGFTLSYLNTFECSFYRSKVAATLTSPYGFEIIITIIIISPELKYASRHNFLARIMGGRRSPTKK